MAKVLGSFAREGMLNLVGGCCGTRPEHIAAIRAAVDERRAAHDREAARATRGCPASSR